MGSKNHRVLLANDQIWLLLPPSASHQVLLLLLPTVTTIVPPWDMAAFNSSVSILPVPLQQQAALLWISGISWAHSQKRYQFHHLVCQSIFSWTLGTLLLLMSCISAQKEWLLEWNKFIQSVRSLTLPDQANRISTPLKLHSWAEALQEFDLTKELIKELIKEFKERFEF